MLRQRHWKDRGREEQQNELVRLLVPEQDVSDETIERLVDKVSESFGGSITFSSEATWIDRAGDLCSQEVAVVEVVIEAESPRGDA